MNPVYGMKDTLVKRQPCGCVNSGTIPVVHQFVILAQRCNFPAFVSEDAQDCLATFEVVLGLYLGKHRSGSMTSPWKGKSEHPQLISARTLFQTLHEDWLSVSCHR